VAAAIGQGKARRDLNCTRGVPAGALLTSTQAFKQGGRCNVVPSCTRASRRGVARPVSNLVSIGVRPRLLADASGAPVPRDQGPKRSAGHGKADHSLDQVSEAPRVSVSD
jgi:hypothetical protein